MPNFCRGALYTEHALPACEPVGGILKLFTEFLLPLLVVGLGSLEDDGVHICGCERGVVGGVPELAQAGVVGQQELPVGFRLAADAAERLNRDAPVELALSHH